MTSRFYENPMASKLLERQPLRSSWAPPAAQGDTITFGVTGAVTLTGD